MGKAPHKRSGPHLTVTGLLVVDVSAAVDDLGILDGRTAAGLLPVELPAGVPVRLNVGDCRMVDGSFGQVIARLRLARSIEVEGRDAAGIADVVRRLTMATARLAVVP